MAGHSSLLCADCVDLSATPAIHVDGKKCVDARHRRQGYSLRKADSHGRTRREMKVAKQRRSVPQEIRRPYSPQAANASLKARSPGAPFSMAMMARRWLT